MTARDLIKLLEGCDIDKEVAIIVSFIGETDESYGVMLRDIKDIVENEDIIALH